MKSFPYPDYLMDMVGCLQKVIGGQGDFFVVEDELQFDAEVRFLDDFKSKNINEDGSDFSEGAKLEDCARFVEQMSIIFKNIKAEVLMKLGKKSGSNIAKLEQDGNEFLN